jgi:hypothetical protein
MDDVGTQLAESAPRFAREALAALSSGDEVGFALYAATSLEHLLKSFLAGKHPALIVDGKNLDSLLHACGQAAVANTPRDKVKTISAGESLERVTRFIPLVASQTTRLQELFGIRNGAVHLADKGSIAPYVLPFLKASEEVRQALLLDRETYWGEYVTLADQTIQEHVAAAELKVAAALAAAKALFAERFEGLEERARALAVTALETNTLYGDEEQHVDCPACGATALAEGTVEVEWEYEQVGEEDFVPHFTATFIADRLRCNVCRLRLDDDDELRAAGVARMWLVDVDPARYYEEPDEDWYRDR